jgi:hypothetical protein
MMVQGHGGGRGAHGPVLVTSAKRERACGRIGRSMPLAVAARSREASLCDCSRR